MFDEDTMLIACTFPDEEPSLCDDSNAGTWNSSFSHIRGNDVIEQLHVKRVRFSDVILAAVHCIIHRVPEKREHQYFVHNFNKSGYTFAIFGTHHRDNSGNRKMHKNPLPLTSLTGDDVIVTPKDKH